MLPGLHTNITTKVTCKHDQNVLTRINETNRVKCYSCNIQQLLNTSMLPPVKEICPINIHQWVILEFYCSRDGHVIFCKTQCTLITHSRGHIV